MRALLLTSLLAPVFLTMTFTAQGAEKKAAPAVEKPVVGRPNPDAFTKPSPHDTPAAKHAPVRATANEGERPLVGEAVPLDEALKLLNKLAAFKGKLEGAKPAVLKKDVAALLAGDNGYRVDAFGCDKLNPLTDEDGRIQIMECTLQFTRVGKQSDTQVEVNFGTDGWSASTAKIKDAVFRVLSE